MSTISNFLSAPPDNYSTTLNGSITNSALSIVLNDVTGLGTEGVGVIYQKDTSNLPVAGTIEFLHWTNVSGSTLTLSDTGDRGITGSASGAQAHSSGDTFEVWVHSKYYSGPRTAVLADHNDGGTHKINVTDAERYAVDAGSTDAYAITLSPVPAAYAAGMMVSFKANTTSAGAATINVNSLGVKNIKVVRTTGKSDPHDGELVSGMIYQIMYDGTDFVLVSPSALIPAERIATDAITLGTPGKVTSSFTTTTATAFVDVTNLFTTVTVPAGGRGIEITGFASAIRTSAIAGTALSLAIYEGATQIASCDMTEPVSGYNMPAFVYANFVPSAGVHTYKIAVFQGAAGTLTVPAGITSPAYIVAKMV